MSKQLDLGDDPDGDIDGYDGGFTWECQSCYAEINDCYGECWKCGRER